MQGLEVVHKTEDTRTYKEKLEKDMKIVNVNVLWRILELPVTTPDLQRNMVKPLGRYGQEHCSSRAIT